MTHLSPGPIVLLALLGFLHWPSTASADDCVALGKWTLADGSLKTLPPGDLLSRATRARVILLGEEHDNAQHHAWQLHVLAALHASQPEMMIGFESFPRRVQPVLDRWVSGQLSEAELLRDTQWERVWGIDAQLYLPLFHFARMHRIPMLALNVERSLVQRVGQQGWRAIPLAEREGVGDPSPATPAYLQALYPAFRAHGAAESTPSTGLEDPRFRNFADSMLLWDRAMAEAIARPLLAQQVSLVVGIAGRGHLEYRHGIPRQLQALGIDGAVVLLPWDTGAQCESPPANIADAVFGLNPASMRANTPRLGVELAPSNDRVRIQQVVANSVAAQSGLLAGDILETVAGTPVTSMQMVISIVRRQAPGTWLPIVVSRDGKRVELVAKFPPKS
ncbi:MAG: ChaN family lipoprotein [Burkholderiales bacterium]